MSNDYEVKLLGFVINNTKYDDIKTITAAYIIDNGVNKIERLYEASFRIKTKELPSVYFTGYEEGCSADFGFGELSNCVTMSMKFQGPPKEMTLEEIEKKLGYKVKIISEKE